MSNVRWRAPAWALFAARHESERLADDLPVAVTTDQMGPARILHLTVGEGQVSIAIALGKMPEATLAVPNATAGAACVAALASWLGVPVPRPPTHAVAQPPPITVGAIDMGKGKGDRHVWQLVQLVLAYDARLYLIWRVAGTEAFVCEHESVDRDRVIAAIASMLRDGVRPTRETLPPRQPSFVFDGQPSSVLAQTWAQKLGIAVAEVTARLEAAGRAHVDPLYAQIDTAFDAWPSDPHAAAIRTMKLAVSGCVGAVWSAIAHRGAEALGTDEVGALRDKLRSLAAKDFLQRLYHQDEVHALLLR
jgi:hypothetical protein